MKSNLAIFLTFTIIFIIVFRIGSNIEKNQLLIDSSIQNEIKNQKNIRKVSYGEGEFEKIKNKWEKDCAILYIDISKNMQIGIEQITVHNFIQHAKKFNEIKSEIEKIDPPGNGEKKYINIYREVLAGRILCQSYITNYKKFDYYFRVYYLLHFKNTISQDT